MNIQTILEVLQSILNNNAYLVVTGLAIFGVYLYVSKILHKIDRNAKKTHGNARFAEIDELREKELLHRNGGNIVLGSIGNEFIGATCHALVIAPTGSGKGVGIVVPTLLSYKGSVVINDPKGENYSITACYRESLGQDVVVYDPWGVTDAPMGQCNPLEYIDIKQNDAISKIDDLVTAICGENSGGDNAFFYNAAKSFCRFCIMYVCAKKKDTNECNLSTVFDLVFAGKDEVLSTLEEAKIMSDFDGKLSKVATSLQKTALDNNSEFAKPFLSVMSNAEVYFDFLMDTCLCKFFQKNTINMKTIQDEKASIYIVTAPDRVNNSKVFLRIVYTMIYTSQFKHKPKTGEPELLILIDEMSQLGTFNLIKNTMNIVRGYGVRLLMIVQDLAQMRQYYKEGSEEFSSVAATMFFGAKSLEVCREISTLLGNKTAKQFSRDSKNRTTTSEMAQPLLSIDEVAALPADKAIIFTGTKGLRPVLATRILYYKDSRFKGKFDKFND